MRFDLEPWVKLYKNESTDQKLMSLEARCFRDFLLRHADESGVLLKRSENVPRDLAKAVSADSTDAENVARWIRELENAGFLAVSDSGRVEIINFEEAQKSRSPGAKRQAKYAESVKNARQPSVTESVTSDVSADVSETSACVSFASEKTSGMTSQMKRRDEKRNDDEARARDSNNGISNNLAKRLQHRKREPFKAPLPRLDPIAEPILARQWFPSVEFLAWLKENEVNDALYEKTLAEFRDKNRRMSSFDFFDARIISFFETAIRSLGKKPASIEV